jgi:oligoribonuclease (3'-5' exoribonuclease)
MKQGAHLALADIRESIRELQHYRAHLLAAACSGHNASANSSQT